MPCKLAEALDFEKRLHTKVGFEALGRALHFQNDTHTQAHTRNRSTIYASPRAESAAFRAKLAYTAAINSCRNAATLAYVCIYALLTSRAAFQIYVAKALLHVRTYIYIIYYICACTTKRESAAVS